MGIVEANTIRSSQFQRRITALLRRLLDQPGACTFTRDKIDAEFAATNGAVSADLTFSVLVGSFIADPKYEREPKVINSSSSKHIHIEKQRKIS